MAFVRGVALVTSLQRIKQLAPEPSLENLNDEDAEFDLDDLLVTASDAIYDHLDADGVDPTKLINAEVYERVVAWHFLALLAALGHFSGGEGERSEQFYDRFTALSDRYYDQFTRPRLTGGRSPARPSESIPRVKNVRPRPLFGGC